VTIIAVTTFAIGAVVAAIAAVIDARTHRLPNMYTIPLAAIGVVGLAAASLVGDEPVRWAKMALGVAVFCGPWFISHLISPASIGFGDIKYSAGLGVYLGWLAPAVALLGFFVAPVIYAVAYLVARKRTNEPIPFGPSLLSGAAVAVGAYPLLF